MLLNIKCGFAPKNELARLNNKVKTKEHICDTSEGKKPDIFRGYPAERKAER
jgi:hypothetical protein